MITKNPDAQLYDRRIARYEGQEHKSDSLDHEEFLEVASTVQAAIYQANNLLFEIDNMAEKKFFPLMSTLEFDRLRRGIDKSAEKLQRAVEFLREVKYFIKKIDEDQKNLEKTSAESDNKKTETSGGNWVTDEELASFIIKRSQSK